MNGEIQVEKWRPKWNDENDRKKVFLKIQPIPKLRILGPIIYLIITMTVTSYIICKIIGGI